MYLKIVIIVQCINSSAVKREITHIGIIMLLGKYVVRTWLQTVFFHAFIIIQYLQAMISLDYPFQRSFLLK